MGYNRRLGLILFTVYLFLYGGFVLLNSFAPQAMEQTPLAGINLAISYGLGLIIAAFILAMIYGLGCRPEDDSDSTFQAAAGSEPDRSPAIEKNRGENRA